MSTLRCAIVLLLLTGIAAASDAASALRVTELMYHAADPTTAEIAAGGTTSADDYDYIELQNVGDAPISTASVTLAAGITYTLPAATLSPGAFVVVARHPVSFTARYGGSIPVLGPYTGNLSNSGETIEVRVGGVISLAFTYADAWHPTTDGPGPSLVFLDASLPTSAWSEASAWAPSGLAAGSPAAVDPAAPPTQPVTFSHARGLYAAPFALTLACATPGAEIRYSLNGDVPTDTGPYLYTGPLWISATTTVRVIASKPGLNPSPVATHSFIFPADVVAQSPYTAPSPDPKWPQPGWGGPNGQRIVYGMAPSITQVAPWAAQVEPSLRAIPSISLVTDLDHLFDATDGIYVNAMEDGRDWERPTSVELIQPDGSAGFQIEGGVRIRGGYSRSPYNPKHGFRLFFRGEYGGDLAFPLFDGGVQVFEKIDLRCEQNHSWHYGSPDNAMIREVFARDTHRAMGRPATRSRWYHLYLNGHYWGLFMSEERPDADYAASTFGGDDDDYDVMKVETTPYIGFVVEATDGDAAAWGRLHAATMAGLASDDAYFAIQGLGSDGQPDATRERLLDVDSLIDYQIAIFYTGDLDAPLSHFFPGHPDEYPNNFYAIHDRVRGSGFQFIRRDAEHSLDISDQVAAPGQVDRTGPFPVSLLLEHFNPQVLHQALSANPRYRARLAARADQLLAPGGVLGDAAVLARLQARIDEVEPAVVAESARWGAVSSGTPLTADDWRAAVARVLAWIPGRAATVRAQLEADGFTSTTTPPSEPPAPPSGSTGGSGSGGGGSGGGCGAGGGFAIAAAGLLLALRAARRP